MSETRQYELVYVAAPDLTEDGVAELHTQVEEIVTDLGGRIEKTDNWGRRRLAYDIGKYREGTYVVELIEGPGTIVSELDRRLKVRDDVLRHLVVRVDEDLKKARRSREKRQSWQQRRRAARGLPPIPEPTAAPSLAVTATSADGPAVAASASKSPAVPSSPAPATAVDPPTPPAEAAPVAADTESAEAEVKQ